jgi:alpha-glucosidase
MIRFIAPKLFLKKLGYLICILISVQVFAQPVQVGKVNSWNKSESGITGNSGEFIFSVKAWSPHIFRVQVSKEKKFSDFSYALTGTPDKSNGVTIDTGSDGLIKISTEQFSAEVGTSPFWGVSFKNSSGDIISEDERRKGFGTIWFGEKVTVYKKLQPNERFVGLGQALGNLDKRGMGFTLDNTDNYRYGDPRIPMYISIPFYIGIHNGMVYGIFYNNSFKSEFNFGASNTLFSSAAFSGGELDYFFIYDVSIEKVLEHYSALTGRMPLPPMWSLGYHQSRCSYFPQSTVLDIASAFRTKKIPADCIVLDADYLYDYQPFRTHKVRFPDLKGMVDTLKEMGFEITASVNPGSTLDSTYEAHVDGLKNDVFLKYPDGSYYDAFIEPVHDYFIDYTSPKAREWWISKMQYYEDHGIKGYWNDMNEPAVSGQRMPDNVVFNFDGRKAYTLEAKNVYGMQMARASYEAGIQNGKGVRPFVMSRSGFAGVQRYAAVWSGDNMANDEHLLKGFLLNTQMGLSGIPFTGPDIGGYIGDGNKELFSRWIAAGIFSPFLRTHREAYAAASEPWSYGEETEAISKTYIGFRYRLLPYIYSKFHEASETGMPVARSLCINYPFDDKIYDPRFQFQFLFGDAFLVVPMESNVDVKRLYLPQGKWYDLYTDEVHEGNIELLNEYPIHRIPLFVKESSVIPLQSLIQTTKEKPSDSLYIHIYYGDVPNDFIYYEDDGESFDYASGKYFRRKISFDPVNNRILLSEQEGSFTSHFKELVFVLHGFPADISGLTVNGQKHKPQNGGYNLIEPLKDLKNIYLTGYVNDLLKKEQPPITKTVFHKNTNEEITIKWQTVK